MKIKNITTETYRWPRHKPITNGKHTYTHSGVGLVKIESDEGVTGIGLGDVGGIAKAAIDYFTPLLIGEDPIDVERLWHKMWVPKLVGRPRDDDAGDQRYRYRAVDSACEKRMKMPAL